MKKKMILLCGALMIAALAVMCLLAGSIRTDVHLTDFELSEDGGTMTLYVGVSSSAGYVRGMREKPGGDNKYLSFYSTWGINSKIGARDSFELSLNPSAAEIYFYSGNGTYKKVLEKNEATGQWSRSQ